MSLAAVVDISALHALAIVALVAVGAAALVAADSLLRKVMGLTVLNSGVVILFVYVGSLAGDDAPILVGEVGAIADPLPQELMLTAIVIGVCVTALALALVLRLFARYATVSARRIRELSEAEDE